MRSLTKYVGELGLQRWGVTAEAPVVLDVEPTACEIRMAASTTTTTTPTTARRSGAHVAIRRPRREFSQLCSTSVQVDRGHTACLNAYAWPRS